MKVEELPGSWEDLRRPEAGGELRDNPFEGLPLPRDPAALEWLAAQAERLRVADSAPKPLVMGRDLIALGMKPGVEFGRILKAAYEAQLDGVFATHEEGVEFVIKMKGTRK